VTERHRYRLVEHANDSETGLLLCTVDGATERGVAVQPDDDLIVLYRPGFDRAQLERWTARLCDEGHDVVAEGEPA